MKKVYKYQVKLYKGPSEGEFTNEAFEVALENDNLVVLKDDGFTKLGKTKRYEYTANGEFDKPHIFEMNWKSDYFEDYIIYSEYTYKKVRPETIKNRIIKWIEEKYGWVSHMNLEFIK